MADRKAQIVEAAAELLQTRSFSAFSYQHLADRLGIRKASIHHHFSTKEDLGVALIQHYLDLYAGRLSEIDRHHRDPWERLEAFLEAVTEIRRSGDKICCAGAFQAEHNVLPQRVREGVASLLAHLRSWLAAVLAEGRGQGAMHFPGQAADQAALIVAALQGALQNARCEGHPLYRAVVGQLRAGLRAESGGNLLGG